MPHRAKILVVDDNDANRYAISHHLRVAGYAVIEASTGKAGVRLLESERPDLVILDIHLPDISGLEVCRLIRKQPQASLLPVIQVSATFIAPSHRIAGMESGADVYLPEPIEPRELLAYVHSMLRVREAEAARLAAESRYRFLFENSPDAIFTLDFAGRFLLVNPTCTTMFGYSNAELLQKTFLELCPSDTLAATSQAFRDCFQKPGPHQIETAVLSKSGDRIELLIHGSALPRAPEVPGPEILDTPPPLPSSVSSAERLDNSQLSALNSQLLPPPSAPATAQFTAKNITVRHHAQTALRLSEARFRALADTAPSVVWTARPDGSIDFMSTRYYELTGAPPGAGEGFGWLATVHPTERDSLLEQWTRVARTGEPFTAAFRSRLKDGTHRWFITRATCVRDEHGHITQWCGTTTDIHEHKLTEHKLETLVADRTARLHEVVNELQHISYAIAHDMRGPLRAMHAFASILNEKTVSTRDHEAIDYTQRIIAASSRLDALIQDALSYTKAVLQDLPLEPIDLNPLIAGIISSYPNLSPQLVDITFDPLPLVVGNHALLTQCFSNLLGNAVKFVAPGVRPKIHISASDGHGTARITVQDNGIGIPEHAQARLFSIFQRLTHDYDGTGMGLAIVRKVVERMGGHVGVKSRPGHGSQFWVELKLADPLPTDSATTPAATVPQNHELALDR